MSLPHLETLRRRAQEAVLAACDPLLGRLVRWGVTADRLTVAGLVLCVAAAGLLLTGRLVGAGVLFLAGSALDMFDGALARRTGTSSPWGAFLDSSLDRMAEAAVFCALIYWFASRGEPLNATLTGVALTGAMLTSYLRARAEALGADCTVGWMSRTERVLILGGGLLFMVPAYAVWALVVLTWWTVAQRLVHVAGRLRSDGLASERDG